MELDQQKEQFSIAYLRAITAVAGYNVYEPEVDEDSVDWGIAAKGSGGTLRSPRVELQLKCTAGKFLASGILSYRLKLKNYDDLRHTDFQVPRILVVVQVPRKLENWLVHSEKYLALRRCGYWISIRGLPAVASTGKSKKVTVTLPKINVFSPDQLKAIMVRVGKGGLP